jgi:hypothetical protein
LHIAITDYTYSANIRFVDPMGNRPRPEAIDDMNGSSPEVCKISLSYTYVISAILSDVHEFLNSDLSSSFL